MNEQWAGDKIIGATTLDTDTYAHYRLFLSKEKERVSLKEKVFRPEQRKTKFV